jgi:hypothetical protein
MQPNKNWRCNTLFSMFPLQQVLCNRGTIAAFVAKTTLSFIWNDFFYRER